MKAYVSHFPVTISPYSGEVASLLIGNKSLRQNQQEALLAAGVDWVEVSPGNEPSVTGCLGDEEYLSLSDTVYFSSELISEFVIRARELTKLSLVRVRCALKRGGFTQRSGINLQHVDIKPDYVAYHLWYCPKGLKHDFDKIEDSTIDLVIDPDEFNVTIPMPPHMCSEGHYNIPVANKFIVQIDHWVNLWMANVTSALYYVARVKKSAWHKQLWLVFKARSFNLWNILHQANSIGKNCDIHQTARVEGCTIGNNVKIEAGAVIRNSTIGNGVSIGNNVVIQESVIGDGCVIMVGHIVFSVLYPRIFSVTGMITASMIGADCFLGSNSIMTDFRLDKKNVMLFRKGKLVDSGHTFLGSCLGDGVYIGAGCVVAPGRTIPAGKRIALSQSKVVSSCKEDEDNIEGYRLIAH